jgi:hypothetical protein
MRGLGRVRMSAANPQRSRRAGFHWSMIFSENRAPLFRIML